MRDSAGSLLLQFRMSESQETQAGPLSINSVGESYAGCKVYPYPQDGCILARVSRNHEGDPGTCHRSNHNLQHQPHN